eukprot:COSAG02_NODE_3798_length_6216_cov_2.899951_4_plen_104_part_00
MFCADIPGARERNPSPSYCTGRPRARRSGRRHPVSAPPVLSGTVVGGDEEREQKHEQEREAGARPAAAAAAALRSRVGMSEPPVWVSHFEAALQVGDARHTAR